jgi:hypothetical protein
MFEGAKQRERNKAIVCNLVVQYKLLLSRFNSLAAGFRRSSELVSEGRFKLVHRDQAWRITELTPGSGGVGARARATVTADRHFRPLPALRHTGIAWAVQVAADALICCALRCRLGVSVTLSPRNTIFIEAQGSAVKRNRAGQNLFGLLTSFFISGGKGLYCLFWRIR